MAAALQPGWVAPELADELPGVDVYWVAVAGTAGRSPRPVRRRLSELADRITGARAIQSRQDSVPWAYRVLWRRLGVDPDSDRPPFEALLAERLERGGLRSRGLPADAVAIATLETGVPVLAWDADRLAGAPGLRATVAGEGLGGEARAPRAGEIVYADRERPIARLDGTLAATAAPSGETARIALAALAAPAISQLEVEEALWTAAELVGGGASLELGDQGRTQ
ncbi:MAG: B3/4 domain-containing protein [Solirubrobacterales bacterium]|nr:B3/4 domain-containing protein [Solirubrobacterales bacterium]